jgi:hypothetical protein
MGGDFHMNILRFGASIAIASLAVTGARADGPAISYVPGSMVQSTISYGPWTLHEKGTIVRRDWFDVDTIPDPFAHDASGIVPTTSGPPYGGAGMPYAGYCDAGGKPAVNHGFNLMQPYYFPFVRKRGPVLEGYFDYRPRNQQEATVAAVSTDWGATWFFTGKALALNPYCPWDPTDPDNLNISVNGVKTAYGSSSANAADNGLGHPTVLSVNGKQHIYTLNRANNHIDSDQLVVHELPQWDSVSLFTLPAYGFVSPIASGGYPALDATAKATTGLQNPDAAIGSVELGKTTAVVYVEKTLNADTSFPASEVCPSTPAFALTNLVNKKPRKANHDVIAVRVATTTDGINFTDAGTAAGLFDPTTVALNGTRWLGSGSLIRISDGRYGMFFGAGNCLDNDSDGFHYIGYAETVSPVRTAADLLTWKVINGLDNPILSTDTVTDPSGPRPYPLNAPIVNVHGGDALTPSQVAPWVPPAPAAPLVIPPDGYNANFFSGRVYDPQAIWTGPETLTIVFAGYNTPQPSNNLGDYRTIGRFQLRVPPWYFSPRE